MKYDAYRYLWPPRPENSIPHGMIRFYQSRGHIAQVKKNGTCTLIFCRGDEVIFKGRHDNDLLAWSPLPEHRAIFAGSDEWQVFVAELLHNKVPGIRNQLYLFDQIVSDGIELTGWSLVDRMNLLATRFPAKDEAGIGAARVGPNLMRAVPVNALEWWPSANDVRLGIEDEGFVFKQAKAPLLPCVTSTANGAWQVKCRRPTKNYPY